MIDSINNADYADDNAPFVSGNTPLNFITPLENAAKKPHPLISAPTPIFSKIKYYIIKTSDNEKLWCVTVDANLNFNYVLENILKNIASKKVHVLALYVYP